MFQAVVSVVMSPCTRLRVVGCIVGAPLGSQWPLSLGTLGTGSPLCGVCGEFECDGVWDVWDV